MRGRERCFRTRGSETRNRSSITDINAFYKHSIMTIETITSGTVQLTPAEAEYAIESFSRFIQFETVSATSPDTGAYIEAAAYLLEELSSIPCLDNIHLLEEAPDHSPVVIARWKGSEEDLPIILLNSHYDVVPATKDDWTVEPFAGMRKDGKVYGRGAQDMKCV